VIEFIVRQLRLGARHLSTLENQFLELLFINLASLAFR
jgi:hypothetical protein